VAAQEIPWHALERDAVERELGAHPEGLSEPEVEERRALHGPNALEEAPPPSALALLVRQFRSPLIYILLAAGVVTVLVDELIDAAVIGAVLVLNAIIGFTQERRAEVSVRALMQLLSPRTRVVRAGREREIESRALVPGDVVLLESGMRVPADVRLVVANALTVDESLLTGESVPVGKRVATVAAAAPLAERSGMAYAGSIIATGRARGYVVATGGRTELGRIAEQIRAERDTGTPLQHRMDRLARVIVIAVAASCGAGFALGIALGYPVTEMFTLAVALAVAAIPEGLPVVLTITLAVGVSRMARRNAVVRRLPAVETLGSTSCIGSDKTGTLTENRMTVEELRAGGVAARPGAAEAPPLEGDDGALRLAAVVGVLANEAEAWRSDGRLEARGDPTEVALLLAADRLGYPHQEIRAAYDSFAEIPFEPERQYSASIRHRDGRWFTAAKGAPERILSMCRDAIGPGGRAPLDRRRVAEEAAEMASRGLRVLALAWREHAAAPSGPEDVREPEELSFVGLVGMMDPPRAGVRDAIAGCRAAGIRVAMITGDHAATASAIARQIGIHEGEAPVLTGVDLAGLDDEALRARVRHILVFARVAPDQKLRIVKALQANGEVVAVTGDGVNDGPALKAADIGVAMGRSGTDVAREAADMVLTDDDFVSIYAAVQEGRVTFDNVRKATFFLVSTGAAAIVSILAALVLGMPIPFVAAQLLWLNLVTNGLQDVALAFEPGEPGVLERPPRPRREGILSRVLWERTAVSGVVIAVGTLVNFSWALDRFDSLEEARTVALTTMVLFQMFQVGNSRSEYTSIFRIDPLSNRFLFFATAGALAVHVGALYFAGTQFVLRVVPLQDLEAWARIVGAAATILVAVELHKWLRRGGAPRAAPIVAS
jgi:calcium-translocating P-type ATPase